MTLVSTVPDEPVMLFGQADRLKQAMLNILINALEALGSKRDRNPPKKHGNIPL